MTRQTEPAEVGGRAEKNREKFLKGNSGLPRVYPFGPPKPGYMIAAGGGGGGEQCPKAQKARINNGELGIQTVTQLSSSLL